MAVSSGDGSLFYSCEYASEYYGQRFLDLATCLYEATGPAFGWVEWASTMARVPGYTSFNDVAELALPHLSWANFFGPEYVQKLRTDFLKAAPGWKTEDLHGGGLLYVLSPYLARTEPKATIEQVKAYFGSASVRRRKRKR